MLVPSSSMIYPYTLTHQLQAQVRQPVSDVPHLPKACANHLGCVSPLGPRCNDGTRTALSFGFGIL